MRKGRIFRTIGVGFMLLSLLAVSTYATAGNTPLAMQPPAVQDQPDVQSPGSPAPEIHAGVYTDDYFVMQAIAGQTLAQKEGLAPPNDLARGREDGVPPDSLLPSAVEGQPRQLDVTAVHNVAVRPNYPQTIYAALEYGQGLWRSTDGGTFWEQLPFGVGGGRTIVFANSSVAIATFGYFDGADYVNGGVWRTGDGGSNWQNVGAAIPNTVVAVAFDPANSNRIYAATLGAGIYRGDYSGGSVTWTPINSGLSDSFFLSIAVSPSNPSVLYAGGLNWVYRTDNYGDLWAIADGLYPSYYTTAVAVSPSSPDTWYTGARRVWGVLPTGLTDGGFYKSTSGAGDGALVLKNSGMQDTFVLDIVQDPVNSNILYAGTWANGFFRSDDGGDTWVEKNAGLTLPYIYGIEAVPDPGNPGGTILYVATFYINHGVYVSTDRGENWTDPWGLTFPNMFDITTTDAADHLAAATESGVLFSDDGGANWTWSLGLTNGEDGIVLELARDPTNASKLLAATYGGGIWRSSNAGVSWTESSTGIGGGAYVYDIGFSSTAPNTAYAGSYGVFRTTDGGATWAPFGSVPHYVRDVDGHNGSTSSLFAGTHDGGVYMSPSASPSWTAINTGLGDQRIRSVKALASNEVFAGTNGSSAWEYNGASWTKKALTIRAPGIRAIAIHPTNSAVIYATSDQGVYKSTNGGESWTPKNQGLGGYGDLAVYSISIDPTNPNTIYLGTWGYGIFKSTDGGDHWTRLSDPLKCSKTYLPLVVRNYAPPVTDVPLVNGDFESGPWVGWSEYSENGWDLVLPASSLLVTPHSGNWAAWLGGDADEFSVIWQDATVPVSDPTLRFYRWDASEDSCGNDYGLIYINGGYPYAYWDLCESTNTYDWAWTGVDLSPFAGQTVEIAIAAQTNSTLNSNSFIDDVTLGSYDLADFNAEEGSLAPDAKVGKRGVLLNPSEAGESMPVPWFLRMEEPLDLNGIVDLSD